MNNPIFNAARTFLSKKYEILNPSDLYKHLVRNPNLCHADTLKNDDWEELLSKLVFLGQFHERRNLGPQAKQLTQNCFKQISTNLPKTDIPTLLQIFLVMSNVLIYDDKLINHILSEFKSNSDSIHVRQSQTISHCLYKLGRKNEFWQKRTCQQMLENVYNIGVQDYVQYIHIASNLYQMNQFEEESIYKLLDIMKFKFEKQQKHIFLSKFSYQYVQLVFNIYPEIIKQSIDDCTINSTNKFKDYFPYLKRDYIICRKILDKKHSGISLDYFENDNFPNLIRIKEDTIQRSQTPFEGYIEKVLKNLQLEFREQVRLAIYDVDFEVQNKFILNCNGPSHFIEDLQGKVLAKSPNFLMQQRHLNELGTHQLIDLDYYEWDKYDTTTQQIEALKKHLNI